MTIRFIPSFAALAVASLAGGALAQQGEATKGEGGRPITVAMTGAAERPGPGDADGSGTAEFRINAGQSRVCYTLTVGNIDAATVAHIHRAPPTEAGPVVVPLDPPADGSSEGCAQVTRELAQEVIRNPSAFYVNIHNQAYPNGAVRGQLGR